MVELCCRHGLLVSDGEINGRGSLVLSGFAESMTIVKVMFMRVLTYWARKLLVLRMLLA